MGTDVSIEPRPEPTKKEIKEAIEEKHCPYCKGQDFNAIFGIFEKGFVYSKDGKIGWGNTDEQEIESIECCICEEDVPEKVWSEWGIEQIK